MDNQMRQIAEVYNWAQAGRVLSDPNPTSVARLDAELESMVIEAKERNEREWREAYEAALKRCIDAAKMSALNFKLMTLYFRWKRANEKTAFEYADGIPMGPHYRDWMYQVYEILRNEAGIDVPTELDSNMPDSVAGFLESIQ